ncbi:Ankrd44 [Symbiodinium sp. CCMP2592]|nr:Ankrd44 [Symbiodinium sp. CCMP2592]
MACFESRGATSALVHYAKRLRDQLPAGSAESTATEAFFPMYTVRAKVLLEMAKVVPHEQLKANKLLVEFDESLGNAVFVSHEWVGHHHPDPECKQLRVLQDALKHMLSDLQQIPLDAYTENYFPSAQPLPASDLRVAPLYIWYDYFSCPQLEFRSLGTGPESPRPNLTRAVDSIPAYIARCKFFFALCPVVETSSLGKVFTTFSWNDRAWCRTERVLRELADNDPWIIMIKSSTELELTSSFAPFFVVQPAGEGRFTDEKDRMKLAPVFQHALLCKMKLLLKRLDVVGYRLLLNKQNVYLRGFDASAVYDLVPESAPNPSLGTDTTACAAQRFLFQNGFTTIHEFSGGWSPLHFAALRGDPLVIQGLLQLRANVDRWTRKSQPIAGVPPGCTALGICCFFKHHDCMRLLITARARIDSGLHPQISASAVADDSEGIRILCSAGARIFKKNHFGDVALDYCSVFGTTASMEELISQAGPELHQADLSKSLYYAAAGRGGSAEVIMRLVELRADINATGRVGKPLRALLGFKGLQYRFGKRTMVTRWGYHYGGQTPLMAAVMSGQFEGAAALIAAGARLDVRNCRNWTAADFARGHSVPDFLSEALFRGQPEGCIRVTASALANAHVQL